VVAGVCRDRAGIQGTVAGAGRPGLVEALHQAGRQAQVGTVGSAPATARVGLVMEPATTKFGQLWEKDGKENKLGAAIDKSRARRVSAYNATRPTPAPAPAEMAAPAAPAPAASGMAEGEGGGVNVAKLPRKKGEADWQYIQRLGRQLFGLSNDPGNAQTTGGRHTGGSEHYSGRAVDFGDARNSRTKLNAWKAWARRQGFDVLDEGDHIHVSMPGSGT
jgi:hypothetical protein